MINNPANIENDIVLTHGRWCLAQVADPRYLSRPTGAAEAIQGRADQRRSDLIANRVAYCEGATI